MRIALATVLLLVTPTLALAHTGHADESGFLHGLQHPAGGLDHMLAMLAVGVLAFVLGGQARWMLPLSFVGMMLAGFMLGVTQLPLPFVEVGIALSSIVIGGAVALKRPIPVMGAIALVGAFAVFHGHAHGGEMPAMTSALGYATGFALATACLHAVGFMALWAITKLVNRHARTAAQLAAALFALGGFGVLAGWL